MKTNSDLISKLKEGSSEAYKIFFEAFYERLYAYSFRFVQNKFAAEEIVENAMVILWEKRKKMDNIASVKSYLYAIVRNASLDYLKKEKKKISLDLENHDSFDTIDAFILEEEVHALINSALNSLPKKCRKVFELSCIEGLKYKDIAEDMQISLNTVKSQRARAIQLLQQKLKDNPLLLILLNAL